MVEAELRPDLVVVEAGPAGVVVEADGMVAEEVSDGLVVVDVSEPAAQLETKESREARIVFCWSAEQVPFCISEEMQFLVLLKTK